MSTPLRSSTGPHFDLAEHGRFAPTASLRSHGQGSCYRARCRAHRLVAVLPTTLVHVLPLLALMAGDPASAAAGLTLPNTARAVAIGLGEADC